MTKIRLTGGEPTIRPDILPLMRGLGSLQPHGLKELALTRRRGHSVDDEAVREGVYSFGAPVFDASGDAVAAIAVCINKAQLGADRGARHRDAALDVASMTHP